jgi:capsular polysaccharide biosynthesis protein
MDLRAFLSEVRAHARLILISIVVTPALVYGVSNSLPRTYEATARLVVNAGLGHLGAGSDDVLAAPKLGQTYAILATTRPVLQEVIDRAHLPYDPIALGKNMVVESELESPFVTVTMTDPDPNVAAAAANAMSQALVELATDKTGATPLELLSIVEPASVPDDPIAPRPLFNTLLAGAAVLVLTLLLLALAVYLRDDPVGSEHVPAR